MTREAGLGIVVVLLSRYDIDTIAFYVPSIKKHKGNLKTMSWIAVLKC